MVHLNLTIALLIALLSFVSGVETAINNTVSVLFMNSFTVLILYHIVLCIVCCRVYM